MTKKTGTAGTATLPGEPAEPFEADVADPGLAAEKQAEQAQLKKGRYGSTEVPAVSSDTASSTAEQAEEETEESSWVSFQFKYENGDPIANEPYKAKLPGGTEREGRTDPGGNVRIEGVKKGNCEITFPRIDKGEWRKA